MVVTFKKLIKADGEPTELERQIATHLTDLSNSEELKNQINELYFVGAQVCIFWIMVFERRSLFVNIINFVLFSEVGARQQELHHHLGSVPAAPRLPESTCQVGPRVGEEIQWKPCRHFGQGLFSPFLGILTNLRWFLAPHHPEAIAWQEPFAGETEASTQSHIDRCSRRVLG